MAEIVIALYVRDQVIRPYGGDFLVVIFLYCLIKCFLTVDVVALAPAVLLFSYLMEALQYFQLVQVLGLSKYGVVKVVLGTSFEWMDIMAYTLGIVLVIIIELKIKQVKEI